MRTYAPKPGDIQREWYVIDAEDVVLGRLAVQTANLLRGKHKAIFAPNTDTGDFVIVLNADKVKFTGNKWESQTYSWYTRYPGGLKTHTAKDMLKLFGARLTPTRQKCCLLPWRVLQSAIYSPADGGGNGKSNVALEAANWPRVPQFSAASTAARISGTVYCVTSSGS